MTDATASFNGAEPLRGHATSGSYLESHGGGA